MKSISVLDCTLRDGGYCNNWNFKKENIRKIINNLAAANVEIVECGFLTDRVEYNPDISKFTDLKQLSEFISVPHNNSTFVVMINFGEFDVDSLPDCRDTVIDGIRVAFHKKDRVKAVEVCRKIKDKGYKLFVQPMVTMLYSDEEFTDLLYSFAKLKPHAFYLVDSFGMMNKKTVNHFFELADSCLDDDIYVGFHSHNNLQFAYANAQSLVENNSLRKMIIDCSVYGMGRGAGNLNLELFINELNSCMEKKYSIKPVLQIMDEVLNRFYEEKPWGYTLPNYLSAVHMIHPNYAGYLSERKTLGVEDIDAIFSMMDKDKGCEYDEKYIEDLYIRYMSSGEIRSEHLAEIRDRAKGRKVLLIAPGRNAISEQTKIIEFITNNNPLVISINHDYPAYSSDYVFISNIRRFKDLDADIYGKTVSTSNIRTSGTFASVDYFKLLNSEDAVRDNAGLMAIKFAVEELSAKHIFLAGLDGYSHDVFLNFETKDMSLIASEEYLDRVNDGMKKMIDIYRNSVEICFVTSSILQ